MDFLQPGGAWALLGALAILALYLIKRQYAEIRVPSTFLWRRALEDHSANKPMQRLRKNLLMLMQLAAAILLALALMRPATGGQTAGECALIVDLSASMQAQGRMDRAREAARSLLGGASVTVIAAGDQVRPLITRSADPVAVEACLQSMTPGDGGDSIPQALSLARAMAREVDGLQIYVISDQYQAPENADHSVIGLGPGQDNRAIVSFALADRGDRVVGVAQIANYGQDADIQVEAYVEGGLVDVRALTLEAGQVGSVQVELPSGASSAQVRLAGEDAIGADDQFWGFLTVEGEKWVAFAGQDNIFAETALALREDISLYRTTPEELTGGEAALYALSGDILTLSAAGESAIQVGEAKAGPGALSAATGDLAQRVLEGVGLDGVAVAKYRPLSGGTPILMCEGDVVMAIDQDSCVIGFDLHDSNLPLQAGFPVMMQNLLDHLLPQAEALVQGGACGGAIEVQLPVNAQSAQVLYPSGRRETPPCPADEAGLYRLVAEGAGEVIDQPFFMHIPLAESDVRGEAPTVLVQGSGQAGRMGREWAQALMLAAFGLLLVEWGVSRRGV